MDEANAQGHSGREGPFSVEVVRAAAHGEVVVAVADGPPIDGLGGSAEYTGPEKASSRTSISDHEVCAPDV
jgi:hypothetical protein